MEEQECLICYDIIDTDNVFKTKCNHCYHKQCLKSFCKKKNNLQCPYCRVPISNTWNIFEKMCSWLFKTGINKGNQCTKVCFDNHHCLTHHKMYYKQKEKEENTHMCSCLLKTGKNKGNQCTRKGINNIGQEWFCKTHTPKQPNEQLIIN